MLSSEDSSFYFGGMDDKACDAMVTDLLKDDDAEDQTDVPEERSGEGFNESEEERRSPSGDAQRRSPAGSSSTGLQGSSGNIDRRRAPPGLTLLSTQAPVVSSLGSPSYPFGNENNFTAFAPMGDPGIHKSGDDSGEDDDEEDVRSKDVAYPPPGMGGDMLSVPPLPGSSALSPEQQSWYATLPSIGSANHFNGTCDRCCFHPKGRCMNGYNCQHCHFDHEKRKRKNKKKDKDMIDSVPGSMPVSPQERVFGHPHPGLLPQQTDYAPTGQIEAPMGTGFSASAPYYSSAAGARPEIELAASQAVGQGATGYSSSAWYPSGAVQPELRESPMPALHDPGSAITGFDFHARPAAKVEAGRESYAHPELDLKEELEPDWRDEYVRKLEEENRYLRSLLVTYMGPSASTLPPPPTPPVPPLSAPSRSAPLSQEAATAAGQHLSFGPSSYPSPSPALGMQTSQAPAGMSASAAPFCPGQFQQSWSQQATLGGDASTRSAAMHAGGLLASAATGADLAYAGTSSAATTTAPRWPGPA